VVLGCPTLGWAKTRLIGTYEEPPLEGGAATPLMIGKEQVGWVLRSRTGVKPTFVSPGHRVSVEGSLRLARALLGRYRLCDPARRAHELTRELLQEYRAGA
jgi:deoxyribonuclease V